MLNARFRPTRRGEVCAEWAQSTSKWIVAGASREDLSTGDLLVTQGCRQLPATLKLFEMARPERFELPTARFVAEYSIQLSYGRIVGVLAEREGFEPSKGY